VVPENRSKEQAKSEPQQPREQPAPEAKGELANEQLDEVAGGIEAKGDPIAD
jgi:hypothetical protein